MQNEKYNVTGMTCASCSAHVEKAVKSLDGVTRCDVNLMTNSMTVDYTGDVNSKKIIEAVKKAGYGASLFNAKPQKQLEDSDKESKSATIRLVSTVVLLIPLFYISMAYMTMGDWNWPLGALGENPFYIGLVEMALSATIMLIHYRFFVSGFKSLFHGGPNMDTLVALGSSIAFIYSFIIMFVMSHYAKGNEWDKVMMYSMNLSFETSGMVPTLIGIGKTLETYSKGKTTNAIKSLLSLAPKKATLIRDGDLIEVDIEQVRIGDRFIVKPGESVPVDGKIVEGYTAIDESCITGESVPVDKSVGDNVTSATINQNGTVICEATRVGGDTTLNQIVKMVEEASSTKTKISAIADKVAGIFVPIVLSIAVIVFVFWMLFGSDYVKGSVANTTLLSYSVERAIAVLVISCPCALGLATPVAIMVSSGKSARNGILFKTALSMEETGKCDFVVLDKTGTITKGKMSVNDIKEYDDLLLPIAYTLESYSEHPLSKAVTEYSLENKISKYECSDFIAVPGCGLKATIDGKQYYGGNQKWMEELRIMDDKGRIDGNAFADQGMTPIYFADEKHLLGVISVADSVKEDSKEAIQQLKREGLRVIMLTGDNKRTAERIAKDVQVDAYVSDVLPSGKQEVIKKLKEYGKVMMVGDGINDAPALTMADIGVAIGAGSDIAIDSADVVLMKSSLLDTIRAIRLSRHTLLNIKENLFWAFIYNIIMIPVAAGCFSAVGLSKMKPWMGAAMMSISSVSVVLNALRINLFSLDKKRKERKPKDIPEFLLRHEEIDNDAKMTYVIEVPDMMCENCVRHVKEALSALNGVVECDVSLERLKATVVSDAAIEESEIRDAIVVAGYKVGKIERQ